VRIPDFEQQTRCGVPVGLDAVVKRLERCGIGHTRHVDNAETRREGEEEKKGVREAEEGGGLAERLVQVPAAIRDVSFPSAARGYERRAVDSYVNQVNRLIAELEVGRSPQAAVRHALDRVGEQTKAILQQARETAEQIAAGAREEAGEEMARAGTEAEEIVAKARAAEAGAAEIVARARTEAGDILAKARGEADDIIARANAEAETALGRSRTEVAERLRRLEEEIASSREQAETRIQELHAETEAVWKERHELLDEIHLMGTRLLEVASGAARVGGPEASEKPAEGVDAEPAPTSTTD
jgi:cell division septum initiation protein DivIVA